MSLQTFLEWSTQGAIVVLAGMMLRQWVQSRDRVSLDIALVFGTLAALLILQRSLVLVNIRASWIQPLGISVLLTHPYLLLRLVSHFRPVSKIVRRIATAALLASLGAVWIPIWPFRSLAMAAFAFIYFIWLLTFAAVAFHERAQAAGGVTQWRMRHASWGASLLAAAFILAALIVIVPASRVVLAAFIPLAAIGASLNYYFAFSPPQWVRRGWQSATLYEFLAAGSTASKHASEESVLDRLCVFAASAVGARGAAAALQKQEGGLTVVVSHWDSLKPCSTIPEGRLLEAWKRDEAVFIKDYEPAGAPQALGAYGVPIPSDVAPRGLFVAVLPKGALFVNDDLSLIQICCRETAVRLDNAAMSVRQEALISGLAQSSAQLTAANKELEAFSYSVSHDLRAPLRHISGFADLLEKSQGPELEPSQRRYLRLIGESAVKMGELIDSLLQFSRMSRVEMMQSRVNLNEIVRAAQRDAALAEPNRDVQWKIHPLPEVAGDPGMLQQVFANLLANAFKYTRGREHAVIEVGATDGTPAETTIYVKDNGVGFDMAYANRLFGVFQRLHRVDEFEGTGIGLANVQRIVLRHGGRVWAEAEPDKGATFYVALPTHIGLKAQANAELDRPGRAGA
jgi:signal transduction histidine kinase